MYLSPGTTVAVVARARSLRVCYYSLCLSTFARYSNPPADSSPSLLSARSLYNVFGSRRKWKQSFSGLQMSLCLLVARYCLAPKKNIPKKRGIPGV
jgi:hypothetical protein